ncbi:hypothetical protein K439DRAFT_1624497, partial [Ramaria rubella]
MIEDDFLSDELNNPLSTVPMNKAPANKAPVNKAPAKASRGPKQAPPDPKEVYIHVPYLNGNSQEVMARFFVPVTVTKLEDVATTIFCHIDRKGVPDEVLPTVFYYQTTVDKVKVHYGLETDEDWLWLKNEYARAFNKK